MPVTVREACHVCGKYFPRGSWNKHRAQSKSCDITLYGGLDHHQPVLELTAQSQLDLTVPFAGETEQLLLYDDAVWHSFNFNDSEPSPHHFGGETAQLSLDDDADWHSFNFNDSEPSQNSFGGETAQHSLDDDADWHYFNFNDPEPSQNCLQPPSTVIAYEGAGSKLSNLAHRRFTLFNARRCRQ